MTKRKQTAELDRQNLKVLRIVVTLAGVLGFITLVFGSLIPVLWPAEGESHLLSKASDAVLVQLCLIVGGAILQTSLIGWLYDKYHNLEKKTDETLQGLIAKEGLELIFSTDRDPEFADFLSRAITEARTDVVFAGLGIGYLHSNVLLLDAIRSSLRENSKLEVEILYGDPTNEGLKTRLREEHSYSGSVGLEYDEQWPLRYFNHMTSHLPHGLSESEKQRLRIGRLKFMPMLQVVKIDQTLLFSIYGTPNQRGRQSPWVVLGATKKHGLLYKFISDFVAYAKTSVNYKDGTARE